jgi:hypothetical protein
MKKSLELGSLWFDIVEASDGSFPLPGVLLDVVVDKFTVLGSESLCGLSRRIGPR